MPHTHSHVLHPSDHTTAAALNLSKHRLVHFSKWKCGTDETHFKINIYTGKKYICECMCLPSTIVTE